MSEDFQENSQAVQSHLTILQGVIQRMANNSSACKAWCITLVSALFVVIGDKSNSKLIVISYLPILLFLFLDAYYLALEKSFRKSYSDFTTRLHKGQVEAFDLFEIKFSKANKTTVFDAVLSPSVWPFYIALLLMAVAIQIWVFG